MTTNEPQLPENALLCIDDILEKILSYEYHHFTGTTVTVCCLTLTNGYNVIGKSACISSSNFNPETGRKLAYDNAVRQIWALESYLIKEDQYRGN